MIMDYCAQQGIACVYTTKLFFGQFTSSLTVSFPTEWRNTLRAVHKSIWGENHMRAATSEEKARHSLARAVFHDQRSQMINEIMDSVDLPEETQYRMNDASVTFYFNDISNLVRVMAETGQQVTKVVIPRSESEVAFLRANTDKLVRETYFLDRYRYRLVLKHEHERYRAFLLQTFAISETEMDEERVHFYPSWQSIIYLHDDCDLFITRVGLANHIERIEEIVLSKDVSNEGSFAS